MSSRSLIAIALTAILLPALAGCIDITADVAITSPTTARATVIQTVGAEVYPMIKAAAGRKAAKGSPAASGFCAMGRLTENTDGGATCIETRQGPFTAIRFNANRDGNQIGFTPVGPGAVRVSFATKDIRASLTRSAADAGTGKKADPKAAAQIRQMLNTYFKGHSLTFRVSGGRISDTNMTLAPDGRSAERSIAFTDIINSVGEVPDELYAVVVVNE